MADDPASWKTLTSTDGRTYFGNMVTKKTTFKKPACLKEAEAAAAALTATAQWIEKTDPSTGRSYWGNTVTGETTWTMPDVLAAVPAAATSAATTPSSSAAAALAPEDDPALWVEKSHNGKTYWGNVQTKATTWTRPKCIAAPAEFNPDAFSHLLPRKKSGAGKAKKGFLRFISGGKLGGPSKEDQKAKIFEKLVFAKMMAVRWRMRTKKRIAARAEAEAEAARVAREATDGALGLERTIAVLHGVTGARAAARAASMGAMLSGGGASSSPDALLASAAMFCLHVLQRRAVRMSLGLEVEHARAGDPIDPDVLEPYTMVIPEGEARLGIFVAPAPETGRFSIVDIKDGGTVRRLYGKVCTAGDVMLSLNNVPTKGRTSEQVFAALKSAGRPLIIKCARRLPQLEPDAPSGEDAAAAAPSVANASAAAAGATVHADTRHYYYTVADDEFGPFSIDQLREWSADGAFTDDFACRNSVSSWAGKLSDVIPLDVEARPSIVAREAALAAVKQAEGGGEDAMTRMASVRKQRRKSHVELSKRVHDGFADQASSYIEQQPNSATKERLRKRCASMEVLGSQKSDPRSDNDDGFRLNMLSMEVWGVLDPERQQRVVIRDARRVHGPLIGDILNEVDLDSNGSVDMTEWMTHIAEMGKTMGHGEISEILHEMQRVCTVTAKKAAEPKVSRAERLARMRNKIEKDVAQATPGKRSGGEAQQPPSPDAEEEAELARVAQKLYTELSAVVAVEGRDKVAVRDAAKVCTSQDSRDFLDRASSPRGESEMDAGEWIAYAMRTGRRQGFGDAIKTYTSICADLHRAAAKKRIEAQLESAPSTPQAMADEFRSDRHEVSDTSPSDHLEARATLRAVATELFKELDTNGDGQLSINEAMNLFDGDDWNTIIDGADQGGDGEMSEEEWIDYATECGRQEGYSNGIDQFRMMLAALHSSAVRRGSPPPMIDHRYRGKDGLLHSPVPTSFVQPKDTRSPEKIVADAIAKRHRFVTPAQLAAHEKRNLWRSHLEPFIAANVEMTNAIWVSDVLEEKTAPRVPYHREVGPHVEVQEIVAKAAIKKTVEELSHPELIDTAHRIAAQAHEEAGFIDLVQTRIGAIEEFVRSRETMLSESASRFALRLAHVAATSAEAAAASVKDLRATPAPVIASEPDREEGKRARTAQHDMDNVLYDLRYSVRSVVVPLGPGGRFANEVVTLSASLAHSSERIGKVEAYLKIGMRAALAAQSRRIAEMEHLLALEDAWQAGEGVDPEYLREEKTVEAREQPNMDDLITLRAKTPAAAQRWLEALEGVGWSVNGGSPALQMMDTTPTRAGRKASTFHTPSINFGPRRGAIVCEGPLEVQSLAAGGLRRSWSERPHCVLRSSGVLVLTKRLLRNTRRASNIETVGGVTGVGRARVDNRDPRIFYLDGHSDAGATGMTPTRSSVAGSRKGSVAFSPAHVAAFIKVGRKYDEETAEHGDIAKRSSNDVMAWSRRAVSTPLPVRVLEAEEEEEEVEVEVEEEEEEEEDERGEACEIATSAATNSETQPERVHTAAVGPAQVPAYSHDRDALHSVHHEGHLRTVNPSNLPNPLTSPQA